MNEVDVKTFKIKKSKKMNTKNMCGTCGKSFTRKKFYENHIIVCEQAHKSKYKIDCDKEERESMPSQMELYRMLLDLTGKYEKLDSEVQVLRKYVERTKKKINILEWLDINCEKSGLYESWKNTLKVSEEQLRNTFKLGYVDGVYLFLQQNLPLTSIEKHPIKCFDQKRGLFFCKTKDGWIMMDESDITKLIRVVNNKLMESFGIWRRQNKEQIDSDDRFHDKYVDYMRIVLGGNTSKEQSYKKLKSKLYNYLKCDLKNIIQYEFIF